MSFPWFSIIFLFFGEKYNPTFQKNFGLFRQKIEILEILLKNWLHFFLKKNRFIMENQGKVKKKWFKIWVKFRTFQTIEIVVFLRNICSNFQLSFFEFPLIFHYIFIFWRKTQPNFSAKFRTFETKNWEPSHVRIS